MAGFGTELLLFCGLGYVVLGPKRMHAVLQQLVRARAWFDKTREQIESQPSTESEPEPEDT